jgi:L-fucose mutarotase
MLRHGLLHPPLLRALAGTGHGSRILLADANYAHDVNVRVGAPLIYLNLRAGLVRIDELLELVVTAVPLESVTAMRPDDLSEPTVWSRYADILGPGLPIRAVARDDFYAQSCGPKLAFAVASGDERLYANLLLTVGYVDPAAAGPAGTRE